MTLLSVPCCRLSAELRGKCAILRDVNPSMHTLTECSSQNLLLMGYAGFCCGDEAIIYVSSCCWERELML